MPRRRQNAHLLELAKRGAEVRIRELAQEIKTLFAFFPHLRDSFDPDELPVSFIMARSSGQAKRVDGNQQRPRRKRRRQMSAAARKAVSERMRKYWAARRKAAL